MISPPNLVEALYAIQNTHVQLLRALLAVAARTGADEELKAQLSAVVEAIQAEVDLLGKLAG